MARCRLLCQILALTAAFTFIGQACADVGVPARDLDLGFLFKNLGDYPNYDFYLKYERGSLNPHSWKAHLTRVTSGTLTRLEGNGSRHNGIFLIAVPRGQVMPVQQKKPGPEWLKEPPEGGLQSAALRGDPPGDDLRNGYDYTFQVRIDGDKLEVEGVESDLNSWWSNARLLAIIVGAACVLIPLTIVVLVVLLIVRLARRVGSEGPGGTPATALVDSR